MPGDVEGMPEILTLRVQSGKNAPINERVMRLPKSCPVSGAVDTAPNLSPEVKEKGNCRADAPTPYSACPHQDPNHPPHHHHAHPTTTVTALPFTTTTMLLELTIWDLME